MREHSDDPTLLQLRSQFRRPLILILISWLLIMTGFLTPLCILHVDELPSLYPLYLSRFPATLHYVVMAANGALRVACGIGLLSGHEWARFAWVFASFALAAFDFIAFPPSATVLVPRLLVAVLSLYFLFRPEMNDYFVAASSQNYPDSR